MENKEMCYYTLMFENTGLFLNSNFMCDDTEKISDAIRFNSKDNAIKYLSNLRDDIGLKVMKVNITLCEI